MTTARAKLIKLLTFIQNRRTSADIMTITGFMTDGEIAQHIIANARDLCQRDKETLLSMMRNMREQAAA